METFDLSTSQNVSLQYKIASIGDRIFAYLLDMLFIIIYSIGIVTLSNKIWGDMSAWHSILFIPVVLYHFLCETLFNGQSPGKLILRIKVVKIDGSQLTIGSCFIRWIIRFIDIALAVGSIAIVALIVNGKGQRIGDIAASTTVLKIPKKSGLNETAWIEVEEHYDPVFTQAELLSDKDIHIIREVLALAKQKPNHSKTADIVKKTRDAIDKKTSLKSDMSDSQFLTTIVKDYNAIHQKVMSEAGN